MVVHPKIRTSLIRVLKRFNMHNVFVSILYVYPLQEVGNKCNSE